MDICYDCQEPMVMKQSTITLNKIGYGEYEVAGVIHLACDICKAKVILPEETKRIEHVGVKLHTLKVLKTNKKITALALKEAVLGETTVLEIVVAELLKENLIKIDYSNTKAPVIELIENTPELTIWQKILNKFK